MYNKYTATYMKLYKQNATLPMFKWLIKKNPNCVSILPRMLADWRKYSPKSVDGAAILTGVL
jgi:hypothetical protein